MPKKNLTISLQQNLIHPHDMSLPKEKRKRENEKIARAEAEVEIIEENEGMEARGITIKTVRETQEEKKEEDHEIVQGRNIEGDRMRRVGRRGAQSLKDDKLFQYLLTSFPSDHKR